jgi:dTDP-4-amino-4,6-dideoxygalactose transaminase
MAISNYIHSCEQLLAGQFDRKHCILTGRGATALWMCYSSVSRKRSKILLPAMVCLSPIFTVLYAGGIPVFADVLESNATIDPVIVEKMIADDPQIGAVLAVHLYGHQAEMETLKKVCAKYEVLLIEDVAQALGGRDKNGELFGSFGDVSILSFGHTKILDVGGGGAILTDCDTRAQLFRSLNQQIVEAGINQIKHLGGLYGKFYYSIMEGARIDPEFLTIFENFPNLFRPLYFRNVTEELARRIGQEITNLPQEVSHRQKIAAYYDEHLRTLDNLSFFRQSEYEAPWRYTFRVAAGDREKVLENIRKSGFDASSWYPCITEWFPTGKQQGKENFKTALRLQEEVVNLWVTKDNSLETALEISQIVAQIV